MASSYKECSAHDDCRHVRGNGSLMERVDCPWCGYSVSTSNPYCWCGNCYVLFRAEKGRVHFGKKFEKSMAQALAIAIAKSGGARFGNTEKEASDA